MTNPNPVFSCLHWEILDDYICDVEALVASAKLDERKLLVTVWSDAWVEFLERSLAEISRWLSGQR